jgi:predicted alpha/beta superfamily hydrolase
MADKLVKYQVVSLHKKNPTTNKMKGNYWCLVTFMVNTLATYMPLYCQVNQVAEIHEQLTVASKILKEERTVLVRLPVNYSKGNEKYPVVYMLDGRAPLLNLMTGTIEHLVWSGLMPEMILVSIPNTDRTRDMTPSALAWEQNSGGAKKFLLFLQEELLPFVEKNYRVQPFRILVGHSLSGLFTAYAFATKPKLFNAYLAASPGITLPWDSGFVKRQAENSLPTKGHLNCTVFFAIGDEPQFTPGFNAFEQALDRLKIKGLDYSFLQIPDENHWSTVSVVFQKGLRKVWKPWHVAANIESASPLGYIEEQYGSLREKYGYDFPIPESLLNRVGYRLLVNNRTPDAIKIFEKAIKTYPNSANAFDSLAEAFEKDGQVKKAEENYTKAFLLAQQGENKQLTESIKNNLKRLKEKRR